MKKAFGDYKLLAKGNRRTGHLWRGPDHLLYVETSAFLAEFSESYKRIDYKNIQAISYARTRTGIWTTVFCALLLLIFGSLAWRAGMDSSGGLVFFCVVTAIALFALIVHLARGPTCVCKLQTAVQFLHLKPLNRLKKAARFATEIGSLCLAHQDSPLSAPDAALATETVPPFLSDDGVKKPWTGSKLVTWAMSLLVVAGALKITDMFIKNMLFFFIDGIFGIAACVLVIAAFVKSMRYELPSPIKGALWGGVVNYVIIIITAYGLTIWASIGAKSQYVTGSARSFQGDPNYAIYKILSDAGFNELGWVAWVIVATGAVEIFCGLLGLPSALRRGTETTGTQKPAAPPPLRDFQS